MDYQSSGVDIEAGNEVVRRIRRMARSTFTPQGAEPLFFLDYLATGRLAPDVAGQVVEGIVRACRENGCALLGGETAEMPGFYADGEYDLAGFIVGIVERERLIDGGGIRPGDVLIGVPSTGLHTNGYSLARRIVFDTLRLAVESHVPELGGTVGEALLAPHRSYLATVRPLLGAGIVKGMAHITGGGITDNLPRILPEGTQAIVALGAWEAPPIFKWLQRAGNVPTADMRRTFNVGVGLIIACEAGHSAQALDLLRSAGEPSASVIGEITAGERAVVYV
ncbi:MAG: phosphoribosylformylglycinamidine cyclo-ligase [Acidobacteria bacterium]|nr:phosphoribosylformylglycinamidine cyclo-ligase [Acidobacteriota bacterium]